ncbi:MAG: fibrillarin-like rRNA/tRNA 2'-O-methyltransferase [Candidatus Hydrothermarchaeales archaeon]
MVADIMDELFDGVYQIDDELATKNLVKGARVYGEKLIQADGEEYRIWGPNRSKLAAAISNGMKILPIKKGSGVLYLGAASGTTASHISDIAYQGTIYCIEFSPRGIRKLIEVCEDRMNMIPILADARNPRGYQPLLEKVDLIYQDVAQPDQSEILFKNAQFYLKPKAHAIVAIKARSIDSVKDPEKVFQGEIKKLKRNFGVLDIVRLEPYAKDHRMLVLQLK